MSQSLQMLQSLQAPSREAVDALVLEYEAAQTAYVEASGASTAAAIAQAEVKARLVLMVETHGFRHTEKSKRLVGLHNTATTTTGTRVSIDSAAVDALRSYLDTDPGVPSQLSTRFFTSSVSYSMVAGPGEVLKTLTLGKRLRTKITSLLGLCFQVKTNAPSLKIETVTPEKPAARAA
jgi:hypothetical protein